MMDKTTFRERFLKRLDAILESESLDDDMLFSDFWEAVREHFDEVAETEDAEAAYETEKEGDDS